MKDPNSVELDAFAKEHGTKGHATTVGAMDHVVHHNRHIAEIEYP